MRTDHQVDQELKVAAEAAKRQALLDELMTQFSPKGPSETILVHDLASVRYSLIDADSRRTSLLDSLRIYAESLFEERQDACFHKEFTAWQKSPVTHRQVILCRSAGVEMLRDLWLGIIRYNTENTTLGEPWVLFWLLPQLGGSLNPFQANEDGQELVNCFLSIFADTTEFLEHWKQIAPADSYQAMKKWCETCKFSKYQTLKRVGEICNREISALDKRLELLQEAEETARKQYTHSYRASGEYNESLRNLNADRKVLQQHHDQTLRMLTQIQDRRLREIARKAERFTAKQIKSMDSNQDNDGKSQIQECRPDIIRFERKPEQSAIFRHDVLMPKTADATKMPVLAKVIENASEPLLSDDDLVELEINLSRDEIREVSHVHAAQLIRLWEDHDFDSDMDRFTTVFGNLVNKDDQNAIRELFAEERNRRHEKNKLLQVA